MIGSKFGFYHHSVAVSAARKSFAYRSTDLTDLIRDVDKSARCVICRSRFAAVAAAVVPAVGLEIYSELYGRLVELGGPRFSVGDLKCNYKVVRINREGLN